MYRAFWWRRHDRSNRSRIDQLAPLVARHEAWLKVRLSGDYKTKWLDTRLRADVVFHANWAGAYTTLFPARITISSKDTDQPPLEGLEILFHEASHALIGSVPEAISQRARLESCFPESPCGTPSSSIRQVRSFGSAFPARLRTPPGTVFGSGPGPIILVFWRQSGSPIWMATGNLITRSMHLLTHLHLIHEGGHCRGGISCSHLQPSEDNPAFASRIESQAGSERTHPASSYRWKHAGSPDRTARGTEGFRLPGIRVTGSVKT